MDELKNNLNARLHEMAEMDKKAEAFDEIMKIMKECGVPDRLDYSECPREIQEFYERHKTLRFNSK